MRKKTIVAIAFAGGLLNSPPPALTQEESKFAQPVSENKTSSPKSVIDQLADNTHLKPELRAYFLLQIATRYLGGAAKADVDGQFNPIACATKNIVPVDQRNRSSAGTYESNLVIFANQVADADFIVNRDNKTAAPSNSLSITSEHSSLADAAVKRAITMLDQVPDKFVRLNIYFIASLLFEKLEDLDNAQKYNSLLEQTFNSCEVSPTVDSDQIRAAVSILNRMADGLVKVPIPQLTEESNTSLPLQQVQPFLETNFKASEKLKLRAAAIADRLPATDHLRRKTHRDLVFWYAKLGKAQLSAKEKQVLFQLVGINDDRILFPAVVGCTAVTWWVLKENLITAYDCGRG